ncbi:hypothetical protein ACFQZC_24025 [Streptacidiphilus monticola]
MRDATSEGFSEEWDWEKLWQALGQLYPISLQIEDFEDEEGDRSRVSADELADAVKADVHSRYAEREEQLGEQVMRELERRVVLSVLDRRWREHLYEMDYLQEGIGMRALAQRDPLVEYQREGFDMFQAMMDGIKEESISYLFNLEVQVEQQIEEVPLPEEGAVELEKVGSPEIHAKGLEAPQRPDRLHFSAPSVDGDNSVVEGDFLTDADAVEDEVPGMTRAERRKAAKGRRRK